MGKKLMWVCTVAVAAVLVVLPSRESDALAALSCNWRCPGSAGVCSFQVTSSNHAAYRWNFGDGNLSACSTSTSASHAYNVPNGTHQFSVNLIGYSTTACGSPDNIIGCTVTVNKGGPGGFPGYSGSCG